ncbi:MAG: D-2-hydroxyacid dehydrogenase [Gemmatimonadota bacterium]|nr:D-2-hydroxyacid dehydrogenase [Gemmatimonadota bacterium]
MAMKMVLWPAFKPDWMARIRELGVEACEADSEAAALDLIADADAYYGRMTPALLAAGKRLRWIQATSAGLDGYYFRELHESQVTVTNLRGIYSDVIAEHVFALLLSLARGIPAYFRSQLEGRWESKDVPVIHVAGTTLGVLGLGGIGLAVAERGHAFGMRVLALDPAPKGRPDYVERVYGVDELHEILGEVDFFVICAPHTGETDRMIDAAALEAMKPSAIFINIGRGKVVDLAALTRALGNGEIAGAGLDVFEEEPLPEGHPLWAMENVMITPHVAAISDRIEDRRIGLILENIRRFRDGEPLLNVVDNKRGYVVSLSE